MDRLKDFRSVTAEKAASQSPSSKGRKISVRKTQIHRRGTSDLTYKSTQITFRSPIRLLTAAATETNLSETRKKQRKKQKLSKTKPKLDSAPKPKPLKQLPIHGEYCLNHRQEITKRSRKRVPQENSRENRTPSACNNRILGASRSREMHAAASDTYLREIDHFAVKELAREAQRQEELKHFVGREGQRLRRLHDFERAQSLARLQNLKMYCLPQKQEIQPFGTESVAILTGNEEQWPNRHTPSGPSLSALVNKPLLSIMPEMDSTQLIFVVVLTAAGLCLLGLLLCKLFRRLNRSNQLLMETSQILPKDGAESVSTKLDGEDPIKTNRDLQSPVSGDVMDEEPSPASQEDLIKNVFALEASSKGRRRKVNKLITTPQ